MTIKLYDLCGANRDHAFSPYCWRTKMALAHKGLDFEVAPTLFTEIKSIGDGMSPTVPVIEDGGKTMRESWDIAVYLEETYADKPSLFGGEGGKAHAKFIDLWAIASLTGPTAGLVVLDIFNALDDADKDYFRTSREARFGKSLEEFAEGRDGRVGGFQQALTPLRLMLKAQPFIGGAEPSYADYCAFGHVQWGLTTTTIALLEDDDPVADWVKRCLALHGGVAGAAPTKLAS